MIKNLFFIAFICALVGCQKNSVQLVGNELVSSDELTNSSSYGDLPSEIKEIIANGIDEHFACEISDNRPSKNGGSLGTYAYPLTSDMSPIMLLHSSLPCQPNIPYFIFSHLKKQSLVKHSKAYSATFFLLLNPNYSSNVKVVDINWQLNGQNDSVPVQSFTINNLQIGESNSVVCQVFSTDNKSTVYSQKMMFDFEILLSLQTGAAIEYVSGYSYACTNTGPSPIIAP